MIVGGRVKVKYYHSCQHGAHHGYGGRSKNQIDSFLSATKVCCKEALSLQSKLQNESFSEWNEVYNVKEYVAFDLSQKEELVRKIVDDNDFARSDSFQFIDYSDCIRQQGFEYINVDSFRYWIVVLLKKTDFLCAFSCLFEINFEKEIKTDNFRIRQQAVRNFCHYKILKELEKRKLVSRINDVSSLDDFSW